MEMSSYIYEHKGFRVVIVGNNHFYLGYILAHKTHYLNGLPQALLDKEREKRNIYAKHICGNVSFFKSVSKAKYGAFLIEDYLTNRDGFIIGYDNNWRNANKTLEEMESLLRCALDNEMDLMEKRKINFTFIEYILGYCKTLGDIDEKFLENFNIECKVFADFFKSNGLHYKDYGFTFDDSSDLLSLIRELKDTGSYIPDCFNSLLNVDIKNFLSFIELKK